MCSQRMFSHTSSRLPTPREKSSANTASVAALIAPAEVPHRIGNGFFDRVAEDVAHRLDHADLVGGARAAAGQHQPGARPHPAGRKAGDVARRLH